jgi:hypothetical protein
MNPIRNGRFTSSCIGKLMTKDRSGKGWGKPALNYMQEKIFERKLGRSLNSDTNAKPTSWGNLVEQRAFDLLGTEYRLLSAETIVHADYPFWCGSPDGVKENTVFDIKAPYTMKSFCQMAECQTIQKLIDAHDEGETYFWQLVSNAILTGVDKAELIVYCPYRWELEEIREMANNYIGDQNKVAFINWASDDDLPYLPDGCAYKNLNVIAFDVTDEMKQALTNKVIAAEEYIKITTQELIQVDK